ncbi:MAG: hypothetical protein GX621_04250 [Pirellulaceae bacterium]|nr:hypothetical protein [Pirellulaceae bacterium]
MLCSRKRVLFSLVACIVVALASTAEAQKWRQVTEKTKLAVGDKVQVNWHGEWVDGTIEQIDATFNRVRVKFMRPGTHRHEMTWPFGRENLRIQNKVRRTVKGNPFESASDNPFESAKGFRTWEDDSGKFKIEAELVEVKGNSVRLKKRDDEILTVPLDRLSAKDQQLIARFQGRVEEEEDDDEEESDESDDKTQFLDELTAKPAQWDGVTIVYLSQDVDSSALTPDGGVEKRDLTSQPVLLPPKETFFDRVGGMYSAADAPECVLFPFAKLNEHGKPTRFVLCNLTRGKTSTRVLKFPVGAVAVDIGPSGKQVLSLPNGFGFGNKKRVDVWHVEGRDLRHEFGWKPYDQGGGRMQHEQDVEWTAFVDAEHVATLSQSGRLVVWKIPEVKAVYELAIVRSSKPALSPGGKYLAALTSAGLVALDAKTGDVKGFYPKAGDRGTVAFRPDGKQIALVSSKRLQVWEFAGGKLYRDIGIGIGPSRSDAVAWPAANYILVGGRYLVDLERYCTLWDYTGATGASSIGRVFWCLVDSRDQVALVRQPLPHKGIEETASKLPPEAWKGIEPGATVSLEVSVTATAAEQRKIRETFEQQLRERGIKIAPNQPFKLVVSTSIGETETIAYEKSRGFFPVPIPRFRGPSSELRIISFQKQISSVAFVINGESAWEEVVVVGAPSSVQLREGETAEQAVKKHERPNIAFFDGVQIPAYVAAPREDASFGASVLTPNGLRPGKVEPRKPKTPSDSNIQPADLQA